ncbi:citryl-CoA lyase [Pseudoclavibacter endophyticus]|uniref:citrate synthase (unknown stereospecificity) n=1 Tax=Pseudoclavibacter endophyticus TaxID=1778590 RepID=A0A6H9WK12_9MICO|nr:citryl-CoA lyase [Pseudoclavibacter endophyticus]KAB1649196.1 citryl-CoA lyase [Pseudoclavibacter endophyticus]GGA64637.1 citryl-CoA lyase [Pseudoclavibacter endophyticus]
MTTESTGQARSYPTGIGTSTTDRIELLGLDLADDVLGQVSFGELAYWLATKRRPTPGQLRVFEAALVSLADHGYTPTAIAARMTYYSAPDSIQGAIASGLLGGGSRFLGVTEDTGQFLAGIVQGLGDDPPSTEDGWDAVAREAVSAAKSDGRKVPGIGHPVHKHGDPRTPVMFRIAREAEVFGPHLALFEAIGRVHPEVLGRTLPLNGAGVAGAALADAGLPLGLLRGFALLARTAGLIGHLAEEQQNPVGPAIYAEVDRNATYVAPEQ